MSSGSFLTGLAQGFGKSFLQQRQQKHQEELEKEASQYKMFKDALGVATFRGDTNAISHILRSMEEFSSESGKGKTGKANQAGILSKFSDMLQSGRSEEVTSQTPESIQATQQNESLPPLEQSRPRLATSTSTVQKPLLLSNQELAQQDISNEVTRQRMLAPGELERFKLQQSFLLQERAKAKASEIDAKLAADLTKLDAKGQLDATKRIRELTEATGDETKAKELYLEEVNSGLLKTKAQTSLLSTRASFIGRNYNLSEKKYQESVRYHNELIERGKEASFRGDRALSTRIDKAITGSKELNQSMAADLSQMKNIQSEINSLERITTNTLVPEEERERLKGNLEDLIKQYYRLEASVEDKKRKLDDISKSLEEKRLNSSSSSSPSTSPKTLRRSFKTIIQNGTGKKFKFYGYNPDGTPDMEDITETNEVNEAPRKSLRRFRLK